jgi:hypothetical protein
VRGVGRGQCAVEPEQAAPEDGEVEERLTNDATEKRDGPLL